MTRLWTIGCFRLWRFRRIKMVPRIKVPSRGSYLTCKTLEFLRIFQIVPNWLENLKFLRSSRTFWQKFATSANVCSTPQIARNATQAMQNFNKVNNMETTTSFNPENHPYSLSLKEKKKCPKPYKFHMFDLKTWSPQTYDLMNNSANDPFIQFNIIWITTKSI